MITTAAADTLAGLFASATGVTADAAAGGEPAFGQMLSATVAVPGASAAMPSSRAIPGMATLPIGTLVGAGSLPFSASNMPAALVWAGSNVAPISGGVAMPASPPVVASTLPSPLVPSAAVGTDEPSKMIEPAGQPIVSTAAKPIVPDTSKPVATLAVRTDPEVEAPLPESVANDPPVPVETPAVAADGRRPFPDNAGKVERPPIASDPPVAQLPAAMVPTPVEPTPAERQGKALSSIVADQRVETPVAQPPATMVTKPVESTPVEPNEKALPSTKGKRAEHKVATPEKPVLGDTLLMSALLPLVAPTPLAQPIIVSTEDDPAVPDDAPSDDAEPNTVQASVLPAGAVALPVDTQVSVKTATLGAERPVTAPASVPHRAAVPPAQVDDAPMAAADTGDKAAPRPVTPHPVGGPREEGAVSEPRPITPQQPASFAALVTRTEATATPAPAAPAPPVEQRVTAEPGRMGQEMGVAIARHTATGGGEAMTVRLDPVEFGRIEVTLSFDDSGTIRAVVAAESPAALDLLRRDSADLGRSLAEAGIRSDAQSFRFDTRQGSADGSGQGGQRWQQQQPAGTRADAQAADDIPEPRYRSLRTRDRVDLMA